MRNVEDRPGPAPAGQAPAENGEIGYPGPAKLFVIWTVVGVLSSLRVQFLRPPNVEIGQLAFTLAYSACYYPWIVLTPLVFRLERRFPLGSSNWPRNVGILAIVSVGICLLASPLMVVLFLAGLSVMGPTLNLHKPRFYWLSHFPFAEVVFWASVVGGYFIRTLNQLREKERTAARLVLEKSQLEASLNQAKLEVLRARLNPHFLFNSLQNISFMARQDPETASRMLMRLGDLLRAVLRQDSRPENTLDEEIELARAYVSIEQMRSGDRFDVVFEIGSDLLRALVPCFLLQPVIENAIIHGLRGIRRQGIVRVSASAQGNDLILAVTDNGVGMPAEDLAGLALGVGLQSTRERLARMYPDRHRFSIAKPAEGGAEVLITIPLRLADQDDQAGHDGQA